ncbi:MAG: ZIP family metal transporter [Verrucomicrobiales bacterium]|nr:ZIP family metal transporter [Verrucomicrobiales bacterium]
MQTNFAMTPIQLLTVYCLLVLPASLAGGWIPLLVRLTHTRLQLATSFVAGLMLGVGILHLLPHALYQLQSIDRTVGWVLGGFVVMFFIQRFFHFHHHDVPEERSEPAHHDHAHPRLETRQGDHGSWSEKSDHRLSWVGAAAGLTLHTLINGVALAASVEAEAQGRPSAALAGLGTFLVIVLHKPFDALIIGTLMASGGWSKTARHLVNALFALVIPAGAILFHASAGQFSDGGHLFLGAALAFAGGTFLCIATSDLLPELQFHAHDRIKLSVALITGLLLAILVGRFEHHGHDHNNEPGGEERSGGSFRAR